MWLSSAGGRDDGEDFWGSECHDAGYGALLEDTDLLKLAHGVADSLIGKPGRVAQVGDVDVGIADQKVGGISDRPASASRPQAFVVAVPKLQQATGPIGRVVRRYLDAFSEEADPVIPFTGRADVSEEFLVLVSALFKPRRDAQEALGQDALTDRLEDDEESSNAAVSIIEWVKSLKLVVRHHCGDVDVTILACL